MDVPVHHPDFCNGLACSNLAPVQVFDLISVNENLLSGVIQYDEFGHLRFLPIDAIMERCRSALAGPATLTNSAHKPKIAIGEDVEPPKPDDGKDPAAVALGRKGGLRAERRDGRECRSESARNWHRRPLALDGRRVNQIYQVLRCP